jgi:hypothetical protein
MPNHVTTRLTLHGSPEDIAAFRDLMIVEQEESPGGEKVAELDFNRIVPMPAVLADTSKNTISEYFYHILQRDARMREGWEWMNRFRDNCLGPIEQVDAMDDASLEAWLEAANPEALAEAKNLVAAKTETGYTDWYDWSVANWGTKWNAYSLKQISDDPFVIVFDTAWSPPEPVFHALAERFPNLGIHCVSFDECWNFAAGGWFNPPHGESEYEGCEPTDEIYEMVYGAPPENYDDEEDGLEDVEWADPDKPIWAN